MSTLNKLALLLTLLLIASAAESRLFGAFGANKKATTPTLTCFTPYGVQSGETCFSIKKEFGLSDDAHFSAINPNLNCDALFVGQWICISGSSSN
ncbi:hypothetical protein Scep_028578 [Stephania cephalantha]|uniref:LysM domain-containing protein n=1 Tax=Stephania cephalantha TaxID=152367 RepID=A0AAP0EA77_9MAGN